MNNRWCSKALFINKTEFSKTNSCFFQKGGYPLYVQKSGITFFFPPSCNNFQTISWKAAKINTVLNQVFLKNLLQTRAYYHVLFSSNRWRKFLWVLASFFLFSRSYAPFNHQYFWMCKFEYSNKNKTRFFSYL